jgi:hypothetical protein
VASVPVAVVNLLSGAGGLALLLAAPGGLVEAAVALRDGGLRRVARRRRLDVPGLTVSGPQGQAPIAEARGDGAPPVYRLAGQWGFGGDGD